MAMAQATRQFSRLRQPCISLTEFGPPLFPFRSTRPYSSSAEEQQRGGNRLLLAAAAVAVLGGLTWAAEELEIRTATATLEQGSKPPLRVPGGKLLQREHLQNRLVDLLQPFVCSMSTADIVSGCSGAGKSTEVGIACHSIPGGVLYVDLQRSGTVGSHILHVLTGEQTRSLFQKFRDSIRGGSDAHGLKLLEAAVQRYLRQHERFPVIAFDHVDPEACNLADPHSPLLQLGRLYDPEAPSLRPVLILDDADLEVLQQGASPSTLYNVVVTVEDTSPEEARSLLQQHKFPRELAQQVADLVGGRLSHLQEAVTYWRESPRWLSPMRPGAKEDFETAVAAHFSEIKKIIYWDLDRRLRITAGIGLWPSATGDAPVERQSPTDEDAVSMIELFSALYISGALPAAEIRATIGETRFTQLLRAQILGFLPGEGPLHKRTDEAVGFASSALRQYYVDRLAKPELKKAGSRSSSGTSWLGTLLGKS